MKYIVNSDSTIVHGTSFKGYVCTTYDKLVELFREPRRGSADGKTTCSWHIEFEDSTVATIYDWKTNSTPKDLYDWHIGAKTHTALDYLEEVLSMPVYSLKY